MFSLLLTCFVSAAEPQKVDVGVYLRNVDGIDFRNNSYSLQFNMWMRWKGDIDPTKSFVFVNGIDMWGMAIVPAFSEPQTLADGTKYQRYTVEGRFFHKFWLGNFPLDWQKILVEIEDSSHPSTELVYVADTKDSRIREDLTVPGWNISEEINVGRVSDFGTALGDPTNASRHMPHYRYGVRLTRSPTYFWLKVVPPILLVLISCFFVVRLAARSIDVRAGTIVVALLTQVFLQQQFETPLPGVGMLLLLDQIFNLSYLVMVVLLVESIVVARMWDRALRLDEQHLETLRRSHDAALAAQPNKVLSGVDYAASALPGDHIRARIDLFDRLCFFVAPVIYAIGCVVIVWLMRGPEVFR